MKILIIGGSGYIGSVLYQKLSSKFHVDTLDSEWFGNFVNSKNIKKDFSTITKDFVREYDVVVLLAGHSSVQMCANNLSYSFKNNVQNFIKLLEILNSSQKFIYASSSSVYNAKTGIAGENEVLTRPTNYYDLSKSVIDGYAQISGLNYYGLRFGTVNGPSPNFRTDIMINKMVVSAKNNGSITIMNPQIRRPILGISDLVRAISTIIESKNIPGIYNLASFNASVGDIARSVASILNVQIIDKGNSPTYDFHISTEKFEKTYNFRFYETVNSIVDGILTNYDNCKQSVRENQNVQTDKKM